MAEGYEVVYAMRTSRQGETLIKRAASYFGYTVINRMSDVQIPRNTGDFRIMSRRVIEELRRLSNPTGSCAAWSPSLASSKPLCSIAGMHV